LGLANLFTKRQRIAKLAREKRGVALSTLHHVIDLDWMKEAYRLTRKDGAPGIDAVTAADYEVNLEANLSSLRERGARRALCLAEFIGVGQFLGDMGDAHRG
jgi:hypothetical protein